VSGFSIDDLEGIIRDRCGSSAEKSYTKTLIDAGISRAAKKFGEEAFELAIAAVELDRNAIVAESADVIYHLLVVLRLSGVSFDDVLSELEARTKRSGIDEKNSRPKR
jgi:phosphoribosyl-ATP pyrophosphohydrolase